MSISVLPKEIRLQLWAHAYFSQPPRLVALATRPHHEDHKEDSFCPRYSPSPAPTVVNICQEARAEAHYQALKVGHVVTLPYDNEPNYTSEAFYFRFETDILYLPLEGPHVKHYDDSPEVGLLAHFREAIGCTPTLLRNIAIEKVVYSGFEDGSLSNVLRDFPTMKRMIMLITERNMRDDAVKKARFCRAARRIEWTYEFDQCKTGRDSEEWFRPRPFACNVDFATRKGGELEIVPKEVWREWTAEGPSMDDVE
ncbi:uncharacterized protein K460DRAFT_284499 [Cucurbitaria berberidis CBS 394.84]|uniref:2EXR domain-containing protein n=1 Tax=Cucurbitaria berberidis CBS 394.84 TaxID=1168544 RepID=A0A9P4GH63_9PLEO|nr:uncharacterized protein K460DRAFT_284499 [Cucurbitaria berberidis CBS 394.84]KAF1845356.1 hypothetical protein K460DRAFT_284499 [Cucurbitaria berberidis CBS 394.84]